MAIQLKTGYTGRVENLIYYERLGDYLIRTVGEQTSATKRAAKDFGRAASLAKKLRRVLSPIITDPGDRKMRNRLTAAMRQFLAETERHSSVDLQKNPLTGFSFAEDSSLNQFLLFPLNISEVKEGKISITIPEINPIETIVPPTGTSKVEIILMAATVHPDNDLAFSGETNVLEIPYTNDLQAPLSVELETGSIPGAVTVVTAAVRYWNVSEEIRHAGFMQAEIVAAGTLQ